MFKHLLSGILFISLLFMFGCSDDGDSTPGGGGGSGTGPYTVSFNLNGGVGNATIVNQTVASGQTATRPASNPTRNGYVFDNWYTSQTGGSIYNFSNQIMANITIWARWTQSSGGGLQDGATRTINGIEVVFVSAGTFTQGAGAPDGWGIVERQVTLTQGFWISKYPVTQAQYQAVMGENPSFFSGRPNNPVEQVNWFDAVAFAEAVGGRLPTEADWEFAARGGNRSQGFIYSGSNDLNEVGWFWENSDGETKPVGQKLPNELGIYDMSGNVWEWTSDWWSNFGTASVTDPTGPNTGSGRVVRGGSWFNNAEGCRVANRGHVNPESGGGFLGFRVAFAPNSN